MASQKQSLTADDVDANPSIIRHPDARLRIRNRSGQAAGAYKEHIPGPFSWRLIEMQESPAYRALSLSARKVLDRLEIEFERHGLTGSAGREHLIALSTIVEDVLLDISAPVY
jgi:hypothetical protein